MRRSFLAGVVLVGVQRALSQDVTATVLGYRIDEEQRTISTVSCYWERDTVDEIKGLDDRNFRYCADAEVSPSFFPRSCADETLYYYASEGGVVTASSKSSICSNGCTSFSIIERFPDAGSTWINYNCAEELAMTVGPNIPRIIYSESPTDAFTTTTESATPTTSKTSTASTSETTSASTSPADDNVEDDNGPNIPVIVGAVVGSVAGVVLLLAAVYLGIRIGRKRDAAGKSEGSRWSMGGIHVAWPRAVEKEATVPHELEAGKHGDFTQIVTPKPTQRYEMDASTDASRQTR